VQEGGALKFQALCCYCMVLLCRVGVLDLEEEQLCRVGVLDLEEEQLAELGTVY
jgi:hypothetical protein